MAESENLVKLFRIEGEVRGLRSRLDAAQRYLDAQTRLCEELRQQKAELESRGRQIQATIANLEVETKALDERLEKLRDELNGATTNKQYSAVLPELNTAKLARSELEDRILEEMERVDENKKQLAQVEAGLAEREKVREVAAQQLQERHDELGDQLAELEQRRAEAAADVDAATLKVFNELADSYDGEAMAPVEEIDRRRREYACGACNMHVPYEAIVGLMGTSDELVRCTACGRILFLEKEMRGALAKK